MSSASLLADDEQLIAEVIADLDADGVYLEPGLVSDEQDAQIHANVAEARDEGLDFYLVVIDLEYETLSGDVDNLLTFVHDRTGNDGLYLATSYFPTNADPGKPTYVLSTREWGDGVGLNEYALTDVNLLEPDDVGAGLVTATAAVADQASGDQAAWSAYQDEVSTAREASYAAEREEVEQGDVPAVVVGAGLAVLVLLVGGVTAFARRKNAKKPAAAKGFALPASALELVRAARDAQVVTQARAALLELGEAIDAAELAPDASTSTHQAWQSALDHYDAARRVLRPEEPISSIELLDGVGGLVLAQRGAAALDAAQHNKAYEPSAPCFLNPLHGAASRSDAVQVGEESLRAPLCAACRAALRKRSQRPEILDVLVDGEPRHYFDSGAEPWASTGFGALEPDLLGALLRTPPGAAPMTLEDDDLGPSPSVDDVVAALQEDPVLIHPLFGNGARDELDAALTQKAALAREEGTPVYIALVPDVDGLGSDGYEAADELALLLGARLGDGVYYAAVDVESSWSGDAWVGIEDPRLEFLPGQDADTAPSIAGSIAWELDQLNGDADDPGTYLQTPWVDVKLGYDYEEGIGPFGSTFLPYLAVTLVAVGALVLLRRLGTLAQHTAKPSPSSKATKSSEQRQAKQREAGQRQTKQREAGQTAVARPDLPENSAERRGRLTAMLAETAERRSRVRGAMPDAVRTRIDGSLDAARILVDDPRSSATDLIGAEVLLTIAQHDLRHNTRKNSDGEPYRPCFFNPTHGAATHRRRPADIDVEVPVCVNCAGGHTDPLLVRRGWRKVPYYETDSAWARSGFGALRDDVAVLVMQERERA